MQQEGLKVFYCSLDPFFKEHANFCHNSQLPPHIKNMNDPKCQFHLKWASLLIKKLTENKIKSDFFFSPRKLSKWKVMDEIFLLH